MLTVSVVIPALNEAENIPATLSSVPVDQMRADGYEVEILVVDNGSSDRTGHIAREHGARVIVQPVRGYGNAYKAGFANSVGDIIATGDADLTYPFEILPEMLATLARDEVEFLTTDRLGRGRREAMSWSHTWGNHFLSSASAVLFRGLPFRDSQSGMWVFRRYVWNACDVRSGGMAFSQEIKVEAYRRGFRCTEMQIDYCPRGGRRKLRPMRDGMYNLGQLFAHRVRVQQATTARRMIFPAGSEITMRRQAKRGRRLTARGIGGPGIGGPGIGGPGIGGPGIDGPFAARDPERRPASPVRAPHQRVKA